MADSRLSFVLALPLAAGLAVGCGASKSEGPPRAPAPAPLPPPAPPEPVGIADRAWGAAVSLRYSLTIALPERDDWQVDDQGAGFWTARHRGSHSELSARTWRSSRLGTNDDCRRQLRLWRPDAPDPEAQPESVIEQRVIDAPSGYRTELSIGVRRMPPGSEIEGFAIAVGHTVGECYAAVFTTRASGKNAESTLGERLALATEGILPRVVRRGVEDRVR